MLGEFSSSLARTTSSTQEPQRRATVSSSEQDSQQCSWPREPLIATDSHSISLAHPNQANQDDASKKMAPWPDDTLASWPWAWRAWPGLAWPGVAWPVRVVGLSHDWRCACDKRIPTRKNGRIIPSSNFSLNPFFSYHSLIKAVLEYEPAFQRIRICHIINGAYMIKGTHTINELLACASDTVFHKL